MRDVDGNEVRVGDVVKVLAIDAEFLGFLTGEEKSHHVAMMGNDYIINELIEDGLKASVSIEWEIEDGFACGGLYMLSSEFRLTKKSLS